MKTRYLLFYSLKKEYLGREIESTDREIDALVYELYGLTEEEVRIVSEL